MFETAQVSKRGGRETNQDAVWSGAMEGWHVWAVADGLGGMGGGEMASAAAIEGLAGCAKVDLEEMGAAAQEAVLGKQKEHPEFASMRTTLVVLVSDGGQARWMHSGDSRLYWLRGGAVVEQTLDHSVPQALVVAGRITPGEIRNHPDRNRLLKCLGTAGSQIDLSSGWRKLQSGDAFLLASDGFWERISETEMETEYARAATAAGWLLGMELRVVERAAKLREGEADNYSAIAIWRDPK